MGRIEIVNKWIEGYLQTKYHLSHVHRDESIQSIVWLRCSIICGFGIRGEQGPQGQRLVAGEPDILRVLKENLQVAQNQQKMYADRHRVERNFEVGDLVFLRLQPYRQSSLKKSGTEKLKPRFYGPYRVIRRVGEVAYELELPEGSRIHNIFHVSCLKKALGQQVTTSTDLPPLDEEGQLVLTPEKIIDVRERRLRSRVIREYLVRWRDFPIEDATWEGEQILQHPRFGVA
jgi:hypothetical protein